MLDSLLGRGFSSKSKSLMKLTRSRLDVIQRKRNATQKFLKKDIADLLANGLDGNAYGRAEGLLVELNTSDCYNIVDHLCEFLLKNMSMMQQQSECPEDCREAVASLMFAAARFSDLPELRDLRNLYQERYGNSLDYYVNQEFAEKLAAKPSTMERKVKLMQDIALEFSIRWDSEGFEERIPKPSVNVQQNHPKGYEAIHVSNKDIRVKGDKVDFPVKGRLERAATDGKMVYQENDYPKEYGAFHHDDYKCKSLNEAVLAKGDEGYFSSKGRSEQANDGLIYKQQKKWHGFKRDELDLQSDMNLADKGQWAVREREVSLKKHDPKVSLQERFAPNTSRKEASDVKTVRSATAFNGNELRHTNGQSNHLYEREITNAERELADTLPQRKERKSPSLMEMRVKTEAMDPQFAGDNDRGKHPIAQSPSVGKVKVEGADKSYYGSMLPPPYLKPKTRPKDNQNGVGVESTPVFNNLGVAKVPSAPPSDNSDKRSKKIVHQSVNPDDETRDAGIARLVNHGIDRDYNEENMASYPVPKPRSTRRKHSKSRSSHHNVDSSEDAGTERRSSRSRRRDDSRQGLQILFDDERREKDEEEKAIDRLLIHYSKKTSTYEHGKTRRKSRSHNVHAVEGDFDRFPCNTGRDREDKSLEAVPRSASLPHEQTTATSEPAKVFARAASFQPERPNAERHVHPKLPDYDDLAARFAALKRR